MGQQRSDQLLLATKLTIPPVRSDLVARPRLVRSLEACMEHPLTLLAAPAGFGKTVLLSAWARQQQQSVGWVSLDSSDNDPAQFWTYVLVALDTLHPGLGAEPLSLLQSEQSAPIETVLVALINALGALQQNVALVLDDYHLIEAFPIHRAMTFLLDHMPSQFHLVIASRIDPPLPLSRLRVLHQLLELRVDDLRFTIEEAATFLNEVMGLQLTTDAVVALETRTEGWIAGLQLAALSMQGRRDIAGFVSAFTGSHRYIVDYLTDYIGFQLFQIGRMHRQRAEEALNKLGLHAGQEMTLLRLWIEEGLSQTQLAASMRVEPPTATKMLQRMEQAGLIERRADPEDARVTRVYLTERGCSLEQPVLDVWKELEAQTVAGLSATEQALLSRLLQQVSANLS
jgi:DNA-binding MarR family transcriptional regulator